MCLASENIVNNNNNNSESVEPRFDPLLSSNSKPASVQSSEKRTGPSLNSKPAEPGFGMVLSPNSKPVRVQSLEKGMGLSPNSEPAKPGLYPVLSPNNDPAEPVLTWSNSELRTETLNSVQKHNPVPS